MRIPSCLLLLSLAAICAHGASDRVALPQAVSPTYLQGVPGAVGTITRQALSITESSASQTAHFALPLRNYDELRSRIERGEVLRLEEMSARYLPLPETWRKVARWAEAQGFKVEIEDPSRLTVFAAGSVAQVESALQMKFARVMGTDGREYTSAIHPPSVPADIAAVIANIFHLQPHLQPIPRQASTPPQDNRFILPTAIAQHYNATGLGVDGTGETIVIVGGTQVNPTDLEVFWRTSGLPTTLAQFTAVYPTTNPQVRDNSAASEETMDLQWASAMAPGAKLIYFANGSPDVLAPWVIAQHALGQKIHQVSSSAGLSEGFGYDGKPFNIFSQYFAAMAAIGVTFYNSCGDSGSTVDIVGNSMGSNPGYEPNGVLAPEYPASDPHVIGVGGTMLAFRAMDDGTAALPITEGGWTLDKSYDLRGQSASGGGISRLFARPAWQVGEGIPPGTGRLVPDVAAVAMSNFSLYYQFRGNRLSASGTSLSAPIWAGFSALINQARAKVGLPPLGLLGPKLYPLIGTPAFNQITTGSHTGFGPFLPGATNGAYAVGSNYNMVTGLGSPNIGNLIAALTAPPLDAPPAITAQPQNQAVTTGHTVSITASASGQPVPSSRWQASTDGGSTWADLADNATYTGATTETLTVQGVTNAFNGYRYRYTAASGGNTAVSDAATLSVNPALFPFPAGITLDGSGMIYVADEAADTIQRINAAGQVSLVAGSSGVAGFVDGTAGSARFNNPSGIVSSPNGTLTVADTANATIRRITISGVVSTLAGSPNNRGNLDGSGASATFSAPIGVALDGQGRVLVADSTNHTIRRIAVDGTVSTVAGSAGVSGTADGDGANARFNNPRGIAVDAGGSTYVADSTNNTLRRLALPNFTASTLAGLAGVSGITDGAVNIDALFNNPSGLAVDGSGNVYIADTGNSTIRKVTPQRVVTTLAGLPGIAGLKDGSGSGAWFNQPRALALDNSGNVYVADTGNAAIRRVTPQGEVTTLALSSTAISDPGGGTATQPPVQSSGSSSGAGGGGGGGGAPSMWLFAALGMLWLLRQLFPSRQRT